MPRLTRVRISAAVRLPMKGVAASTGGRNGAIRPAAARVPRPWDTGTNGARRRGSSFMRIRCAPSARSAAVCAGRQSPITSSRTKGTWSCSGTGRTGSRSAGDATAGRRRRRTDGGRNQSIRMNFQKELPKSSCHARIISSASCHKPNGRRPPCICT